MAPMIVAPARETPGIIARIWQQPMPKARRSRMSSTNSTRGGGAHALDQEDQKAADTRLTATTQGENSTSLMRR